MGTAGVSPISVWTVPQRNPGDTVSWGDCLLVAGATILRQGATHPYTCPKNGIIADDYEITYQNYYRWTVHRCAIIAIVGESGSGKSTLGRLIVRLLPLSQGSILLKGRRIRQECLADHLLSTASKYK